MIDITYRVSFRRENTGRGELPRRQDRGKMPTGNKNKLSNSENDFYIFDVDNCFWYFTSQLMVFKYQS